MEGALPIPIRSASDWDRLRTRLRSSSSAYRSRLGRGFEKLIFTASPESTGTFQVTVSATKAGYQPGEAETTFQATTTLG